MKLDKVVEFGLLVKEAEAIPPDALVDIAGKVIPINYGSVNTSYTVLHTIYGNDLATDANPARGNDMVSFGLILQGPNSDIVVAIRGTDGIWEWIHDAEFFKVSCPMVQGAQTEDGFTAVYKSLRVGPDRTKTIVEALSSLPVPPAQITISGHSLGGALASLAALDVALSNVPTSNLCSYTYASPRVGDSAFATAYNASVPNTIRTANRTDLVPNLPLPPFYEHVGHLNSINSIDLSLFPRPLVKPEIGCEHHLTTYLYLLSRLAGGPVLPLDPGCQP